MIIYFCPIGNKIMITDFFKNEERNEPKVVKTDYYEYHSKFLKSKYFKKVYNEVKSELVSNSSRKSCVFMNKECINSFDLYDLPLIEWPKIISSIKNDILIKYAGSKIDYGLVHLYENYKSTIHWHSDKEAMRSHIYSISIGGARQFCMRDKVTKEIIKINLYDGDLFIMKPGCQDKYEHCIKSIKLLNDPRISITFRQIEKPLCYFIYNKLNFTVNLLYDIPVTQQNSIIILKRDQHGIAIGYTGGSESELYKLYDSYISRGKNTSLLKSNLQKAIRRNKKDIALNTALYMIDNNMIVDLLRRLTIITFEDVTLDRYYPTIIWYYIILSKSSLNYQLTNRDVEFIYSYVGLLCDIDRTIAIDDGISDTLPPMEDIVTNTYCASLFLRIQFGGFAGEIKLMNRIMNSILNNKIIIEERKINILSIQFDKCVKFPCIMDCAIDFHCYPKILDFVLGKIDSKNSNHEFSRDKIKYYIWTYDSSLNYRSKNNKKRENEIKIWNTIIEPACASYRRFIKSIK